MMIMIIIITIIIIIIIIITYYFYYYYYYYFYYYYYYYPKQLFNQEWNIKPRRGRQRKVWSRMVDDLFKSLDIDRGEWLEDIERGDSSSASFLACVEECISERESRRFKLDI